MSNFFAGPNIPLGGSNGEGGPINVTDVIGLAAELQRIAAAEAAAEAAQQVANDASGLVGGANDRLDILEAREAGINQGPTDLRIPDLDTWGVNREASGNPQDWITLRDDTEIDFTESARADGLRFIQWQKTSALGFAIGPLKNYEGQSEARKIYKVTFDSQRIDGSGNTIQMFAHTFARGGAQIEAKRLPATATGFGRQIVTRYFCTHPDDTVTRKGITPELITTESDANAYSVRFALSMTGSGVNRVFGIAVQDVTASFRKTQYNIVQVSDYGIVRGFDITAAEALANSNAIRRATIDIANAGAGKILYGADDYCFARQTESDVDGFQHNAIELFDGVAHEGAGKNQTNLRLFANSSCHMFYAFERSDFGVSKMTIDLDRDNQAAQMFGMDAGVSADTVGGNDPAGILMNARTGRVISRPLFKELYIKNTVDYGIGCQGQGRFDHLLIDNCEIDNSGADGIDSKDTGGVSNSTIKNTIVRNINPSPNNAGRQAGINVRSGWNVIGNIVEGLRGDQVGYRINDGPAFGEACKLIGNTARAAEKATTIGISNQGRRSHVSGNLIEGVSVGIAVQSGNGTYTGNIAHNVTTALELRQSTGFSPDNFVTNNQFSANVLSGDIAGTAIEIAANCNNNNFDEPTISGFAEKISDLGRGNKYEINVLSLQLTGAASTIFTGQGNLGLYRVTIQSDNGIDNATAMVRLNEFDFSILENNNYGGPITIGVAGKTITARSNNDQTVTAKIEKVL